MKRSRFHQDEDKRQKEELIKIFLKEKSRRESEFGRLNELKISQQWRALQREAKTRELQQDVGLMKESFEQLMAHKDAMITLLREELAQAEQQHHEAFNGHAQQLEALIKLKTKRANATCKNFEKQLEMLREHYNYHEEQLEVLHKGNLEEIETMKQQHLQKQMELEMETAQSYSQKKEDILEECQERQKRLRSEMDVKMCGLWQELQSALSSYLVDTKDNQDIYNDMDARNKQCLQEIAEQKKRIQTIKDSISYLKQALLETESRQKEEIEALGKKKSYLQKCAKESKTTIRELKKKHRQELGHLVTWSDSAIEKLTEIAQKGDRILKIHAQCKKIEPEYARMYKHEENTCILKGLEIPKLREIFGEIEGDFKHVEFLDHFWGKYNLVFHKTMDLEHHISKLRMENEHLQLQLKKKLGSYASNAYDESNTIPTVLETSTGHINVIEARDILHQLQ